MDTFMAPQLLSVFRLLGMAGHEFTTCLITDMVCRLSSLSLPQV